MPFIFYWNYFSTFPKFQLWCHSVKQLVLHRLGRRCTECSFPLSSWLGFWSLICFNIGNKSRHQWSLWRAYEPSILMLIFSGPWDINFGKLKSHSTTSQLALGSSKLAYIHLIKIFRFFFSLMSFSWSVAFIPTN